MATDSRGHAPGTTLQTDIPSDRLIIGRVDDPLEDRGAHRRYQSIGGSNPSGPILILNERKRIESGQHTVLCEWCGGEIVEHPQRCHADPTQFCDPSPDRRDGQ